MGKADQIHLLARIRRLGHGVWFTTFVVAGYDEHFQMFVRGDLSERFAIATTRAALARELGVHRKHVIHESTVREEA